MAPKGIKKLISLPKETLNSNVKTCTWKSFPLQREQVPTKPVGVGRICTGCCFRGKQHRGWLHLKLVVRFPAQEIFLLSLSASELRGRKEQERDLEPKGFLFFFFKLQMTHWKRFINGLLGKDKTCGISFRRNKRIGGKLTFKGQPGFCSIERGLFLLSNSLRKKALYFLAVITVFHLQTRALLCKSTVTTGSCWDKRKIWISRDINSRKTKWRPCLQTYMASYQQECYKGNDQWEK